jgi:hypothetical protein
MTLGPDRERAYTCYEGQVFNDDGTAEALEPVDPAPWREVADIVHTMLPGDQDLCRRDRVVDYEPNRAEDVPCGTGDRLHSVFGQRRRQ